MFSWLEAIYYTLIQLAKVNRYNAFLLISFVAYLCYQGIKVIRQPLISLFQLMKGFMDDRDIIKERLRNKRKSLSLSWKHRHEIDWKSTGKVKGNQVWNHIKQFATIVPSFLFLLFGNIIFRLIYKLPFVKQDSLFVFLAIDMFLSFYYEYPTSVKDNIFFCVKGTS